MKRMSKYDGGTVFNISLQDEDGIIQLDTADAVYLVFKTPRGREFVKTASAEMLGGLSVIQYTTSGSEFDESGVWTLRGRCVFPAGSWTSYQSLAVEVI